MMLTEPRRMHNWIVITLLGLLAVLCLLSMRFNSPTADEQNHISRGYHYLATGNLDLNVAPPFVNALSAVPLLFQRDITIPSYDVTHAKTYINQFADEFVWVYNDAERIIYSGRLAIVVLSLLLGYFVFRWANELWGARAGLLALLLYVLDPNIVAHSQLVTTDLGVACLIFIATYFLWRFLRQRRNLDLALAGIAVGLAQATKFSALLLLPIIAGVLIIETLVLRDHQRFRLNLRLWFQLGGRGRRLLELAELNIQGRSGLVAVLGTHHAAEVADTGTPAVYCVQASAVEQ